MLLYTLFLEDIVYFCMWNIIYILKSATSLTKCYRLKRNVLLIRNPPIQSARPFQCAYHPLTP